MISPFRPTFAALALAGLVACSNAGGLTRVLYSNIQTSDTSLIPGLGGVRFKPGATSQFDRAYPSENGERWILRALANLPTTNDELILTGEGIAANTATLRAQEGTQTPFNSAINFGILRQQMGILNDGQFVFSADTTASSGTDDHVIKFDGTNYIVMAQEASTVPTLAFGYGSTNDSCHILNNGNVRFRSSALVGATAEQVLVEVSAPGTGSVIAQTSSTVFNNQLPPSQVVGAFQVGTFRSSTTGGDYVVAGDLDGPTPTDIVTVVSNNVVAQEGTALAPFSSIVSTMDTTSGSRVLTGTHYIFRGSNADTIDWVYSNGTVLAKTNDPIYPGSTENYDDAAFTAGFYSNAINSTGDYVIGGLTNIGSVATDAVLVVNSSFVLVRENDPIDLDGDGVYNDNCRIDVFNNDDGFLTDDMKYYFMADIQDDLGVNIGQAFLVKQVGFQPSTFTITQGSPFGGTVSSLCMSDDDKVYILNDEATPNAEIEFSVVLPYASVSGPGVMYEHAATRNDLSVFTDLYNTVLNSWNNLDFTISDGSDILRNFEVSKAGAFVAGDGTVRARMRWIPQADLEAADGWSETVDLFNIVPKA